MAGHCGRRGGGRGRRGERGQNKIGVKARAHTSTTPVIKDDVSECGKPEPSTLFEGAKKNVTAHIRREGDNERLLVADDLETMTLPIITALTIPA